ncbi:GroES-like protein [Polyplosphaeria fusca]|uniref:GroES-like protein n=1 Tax=Polyplosphaeria fusca TaxID=682080 RepID=A0A9P4QN93_9PLEO|nr:GroES-like protein [Polyplosphaeria fusca]
MTALVQRKKDGKQTLTKETIARPVASAHQVLVKLSHAAQNPTDVVQSFDRSAFADGAVLGCDFVGVVEEIGPNVTRLKNGDIVAGLLWGGDIAGLGAYAEYSLADERISFKLPQKVQPAEASTVPLAATTAWLALFSKKCLNIDRRKDRRKSILVWGGSSSVGLYTIQLAMLEGLNVITTCNPRNFELVKSVGAHRVFDYSDTDVIKKIQEVEPDLEFVFDTIGNASSSNISSQAIRKAGGGLCTVRPGKANTEGVSEQTQVTDVLVWTTFNKDYRYWNFFWPADKEDHELGAELFENIPTWLESGKLKPNKTSIKKGLDAVEGGFQEYRDGGISAYKIVYVL